MCRKALLKVLESFQVCRFTACIMLLQSWRLAWNLMFFHLSARTTPAVQKAQRYYMCAYYSTELAYRCVTFMLHLACLTLSECSKNMFVFNLLGGLRRFILFLKSHLVQWATVQADSWRASLGKQLGLKGLPPHHPLWRAEIRSATVAHLDG